MQGKLRKKTKYFNRNIITLYFCTSQHQTFTGMFFPVDFKPQWVVRFVEKEKKHTHRRMVSMCQLSCTAVVWEI